MKTSRGMKFDITKVSNETRLRNPHIFGPTTMPTGAAQKHGKRRKEMNKTEAEFARILQARMDREEIVSFDYEGITLRWGTFDSIKYTPDFCVVASVRHIDASEDAPHVRFVLIEVKGAHIWPQDIQKFKAARNEWPLFRFEMHQKTDGEWRQIL